MRSFASLLAPILLATAVAGCKSASETTDETRGEARDDDAKATMVADVDDELYWYQRGTDATRAIWSKYRIGASSALLRSGNSATPMGFWHSVQAFNLLMDSVGTFWRKDLAADAIRAYFRDFTMKFPDRANHAGNDDVVSWIVTCTRAARITNDKSYFLEAQELYDNLWATQVDNTIGGGMWWRKDERTVKNACVNFPAVIAALNLYDATKDVKYLLQGRALYKWAYEKLFDSETGMVFDYVSADGNKVAWDFPSNQGVFIGASLRLFSHTGNMAYIASAKRAADYMISNMSARGVLKSRGQGDGGVLNGIAVRYLAELSRRHGCGKYREFLTANARSAWTSRRLSDGVNGPDWTRAPQSGDPVDAQTAISAAMLYFAASRSFR